MKKIKIAIGKLLFGLFRHFPDSNSRFNFGSKALRALCGKMIFIECGKNINIEKMAQINSQIRIGDNSGIGKRCVVGGVQLLAPTF